MKPSDEKTGEKSERKYQVFISSTFRDLAAQRRIVLDVVIDQGHMPIALERFPAVDTGVPTVIQKTIEASQIYVVILGFRYGAIVKGRDISFSQLEYENAFSRGKVVVPFLLTDAEVRKGRDGLRAQLEKDKIKESRLAPGLDRNKIEKEIADLEAELDNETKLWEFRSIVKTDRFYKSFSFQRGSEEFDEHMVLKALILAEKEAVEKRVAGWIREPEESGLAEALKAVSQNRFLVDVIRAMARFDALDPRVKEHSDEKEAAASFFVDKYFQPLLAKNVHLFFESGSSVAYVAQAVGSRLRHQHRELTISTNNVLAYLIFWLVHRVRCSLFPWGPPEQHYGAVFGPVNEFVLEEKKPFFPPEQLSSNDEEVIRLLREDSSSPAKWRGPALMLGALSGLQLTRDPKIFDCLGPHVGSPRNKVFKRFMYTAELPLMLFMDADKIDLKVDLERCHFILEQEETSELSNLSWDVFCRERPVAFCVGCENKEEKVDQTARRFKDLGFSIIRAGHKTPHTAFIARNQKFIEALEAGMSIR